MGFFTVDSGRDQVIEWNREVTQLGERLLALLCQGLGVDANKLKNMSCSEGRLMVAHYYPYCPEPDKTLGIGCHSDPGLLTVLLQDQAGGLQVKHDHKWVEVKPVHGALVINIGNLLQVFKSCSLRILHIHAIFAYIQMCNESSLSEIRL